MRQVCAKASARDPSSEQWECAWYVCRAVGPCAICSQQHCRRTGHCGTQHHSSRQHTAIKVRRILTGALTNGKEWTHTWASEILSALAWVQVAMLSGYRKAFTLRAMHQAIHRAYGDSPHNIQGTIKAARHILYIMPVKKCIIVQTLQQWLTQRAVCRDAEYTSWVQVGEQNLHIYSPTWNTDFEALQVMKEVCCKQADCVCASAR